MVAATGGSNNGGTKSSTKIVANIFISFIGSGVLGLPYAFKEAGVLEGIIVLVFVAIVSVKAMLLVIDCKYALTEKRQLESSTLKMKNQEKHEDMENLIDGLAIVDKEEILPKVLSGADLSYGDVGYHAYGNFGRLLVEWAIILSQTGFCCAYLLFISSNLTNYIPSVEQNYWLFLLLPLEFGLCLIRDLKRLALTSLFAQLSNLMAFGVVFYFDFEEFHKVKHNIHPKEWSWEGLPFFLCVAIYCYEGAGMILSLEASLHKEIRHNFRRYFLTVIALVTLLYASFGACGYLSFGPGTMDIITLNLKPQGGGIDFGTIVTCCLCLSLFFTFPIMMFPVAAIIDAKIGVTPETPKMILATIVRLLMVVSTGVVVLIIPDFGNLMAFIGATCCIWLAFILPAVFHMTICARTMSAADKITDYVIIGMGVVGTIVGMIDAIRRMSGNLESTTKTTDVPAVCEGEDCTSITPGVSLTNAIMQTTAAVVGLLANETST